MLIHSYLSALGQITLASNGEAITGLWFEGQAHYMEGISDTVLKKGTCPVIQEAERWLDQYFCGHCSDDCPQIQFHATAFRESVLSVLLEIPYGKTQTYGEITREVARRTGRPCSPRAVGSAIGRNPILILIPCHRVIGTDGTLRGYAGGLERKQALLTLEQKASHSGAHGYL